MEHKNKRFKAKGQGELHLQAVITTALFALFLWFCSPSAFAAAPPAGERVVNISTATYFNNAAGQTETISSNPVSAVVNAVPGFTLSGDVTLVRAPADRGQFGYVLTNTGNTALGLSPDLTAFTGDFSVGAVQYGIDADENGTLEASEYLGAGDIVSLVAGEAATLLIIGDVAATAMNGDQAQAVLSVTDPSIPQTLTAAAIIDVQQASLNILKSVSAANAVPGDTLTYSLEVTNNSAVALQAASLYNGTPVTLDGAGITAILLRDTLPDLTEFDSFGPSADFTPAVRLFGADAYSFVTVIPADRTQIEEVVFVLENDFVASASRTVSFSVVVPSDTSPTQITNLAVAPLALADGSVLITSSNPVTTEVDDPVVIPDSQITIFDDPGFSTTPTLLGFTDQIFVEVTSAACNLTSNIDIIQVELTSRPTGDREIVLATETGPMTGVFRVGPVDIVPSGNAIQEDTVFNVEIDGMISASPVCDPSLQADKPVETVGSVFVSTTNAPLAGITVLLFDANGVLAASAVTDADGRFVLPTLTPGNYAVRLDQLGDFTAPSALRDFDGFGRMIDGAGSYGQTFTATVSGGRVDFDIPVDPPSSGALSVSKTTRERTVGLGEALTYTVEIKNSSASPMENVTVYDQLPLGFGMISGSATLDGVALDDPAGLGTRNLQFDLGTIESSATLDLTYAVNVGANAGQGRRVNSASATATLLGVPMTSNTARASVTVDRRGSVFGREGTILGKVFQDCNENGVQDDHENGIPGVQIFSQAGVFSVTDKYGRYSLPRLTARTHVLDLYDATLPEGMTVVATRVMDAGKGGSRFVSLRAGEVRSEDFAVHGCSAETNAALAARVAVLEAQESDQNIGKLRLDNVSRTSFSEEYEKSADTAILRGQALPAVSDRPAPEVMLEVPPPPAIEVPQEQAIPQPEALSIYSPIPQNVTLDITGLCTFKSHDAPVPQPECWSVGDPSQIASERENSIGQKNNIGMTLASLERLDKSQKILAAQKKETVLPGYEKVQFTQLAVTRDLEGEIGALDNTLGFLDLKDGDNIARQVASIRVKGPAKGKLALTLNGAPVSKDRLGQIVKNADVQAAEWISIPFQSGENALSLTQTDPFGNIRGQEDITIRVPGAPEKLLVFAPETMEADEHTPFPVILQVVDAAGLPVDAPIEVTLSSEEGEWDVRDMYDGRPGIQSFVDGGEAVFDFKPAGIVGTQTIVIESPLGRIEKDIQFTANISRPPVMVGYIEGAFKLGGNDAPAGSGLIGILRDDNLNMFEDTVEGVNGAVFLKGKVKGDALLTLRYDGDKDTEERLFRDVEPDRFYPVYGDQSEQGFDAQSRGELFVKIEKGASYILYGDVRYGAAADAFRLGGYQRSLEGAKVHIEKGRVRLNFYAAETDATQQVIEIPAIGLSGPYDLDFRDVEENSEIVELITRDRDEPSVIIQTERLSRFTNYTLDYFTGALIFNAPIQSVDENLNPVFIRVTFEVPDGSGEKYWVYGGEGSIALSDSLSLGYRELRSDAPVAFTGTQSDRRTVRAAYLEKTFGAETKLQLEVAETEYDRAENGIVEAQKGEAARLSLTHQAGKGDISARLAWADEQFDAPGAAISAGNLEARIQAQYRPNETTSLRTEALYAESLAKDETRYGIVARAEKKLTPKFAAHIGARYAEIQTDDPADQSDALVTAILGMKWAPGFLGGATIDTEFEKSVGDADAYRARLGTEYQITPKMRAYVLSEWSNSDRGEFAIGESRGNNTSIRGGFEYKWTENLSAFSEYRANQGVTDAGIANGINARWDISESLSVRGRVEHIEPLTDVYQGNSSASIGTTWQPEGGNSILSGDIEYAISTASDRATVYTSATAGHKIGDTTLLVRNRYARTEEAAGNRVRNRLRTGAAYRPTKNDHLNVLSWYEYGLEDTPESKEQRHIASVGAEWKPAAKTRIRPTLAMQRYQFETDTFQQDSEIFMGQLGADQDITDRINLGANIAGFLDAQTNEWHAGVGVEANVAVADNVLVGAGYNYTELENEALDGIYQDGVYVRLRLKFDENSWNIFED